MGADGRFAANLAKGCSSEVSERTESRKSTACSADPDCPKCAGQKRRGDGAEGRGLFLVGSSVDLARGPYDQ